ncbi:hypothetical protein EAI_05408 [Harpegnathos saltator]|uniref:Uncharacterized protein n=1 Tax=Harpegnathos saltator TaxID=610380 RepID=E2BRW3_HARSA|nr:hypothetical protein EAI_05408 [Harpegnathos saltator]
MELEVEMREVKRLGEGQKEGEGMVLVKLGSPEEKRKVMEAEMWVDGKMRRWDEVREKWWEMKGN